jgi:hypothetical protein
MDFSLLHIDAVPDAPSAHWRVRILAIDGESRVLNDLASWSESEPKNFKRIINSLRLAASSKLPPHSERHVKKCRGYENVYEAIACSMPARLFFFYSGDQIIICTNAYWKKKEGLGQDAAIRLCHELKNRYESQ